MSVPRWSTRPSSSARTRSSSGLPYRKRFGGDFALGTTLPYVLQNAPGQVLVVRESVAASEQRGAQPIHPYQAGSTSRAAGR